MSNTLQAIKSRIKAVKFTQKTTNVMKTVSASKMRMYQKKNSIAESYDNHLSNLFRNISSTGDSNAVPLPSLCIDSKDKNDVELVVCISSDRGLCGNFNSKIIKNVSNHLKNLLDKQKKFSVITIGKKITEYVESNHKDQMRGHYLRRDYNISDYELAYEIANEAKDLFIRSEINRCVVIYSHFKSVVSQEIVINKILPLNLDIKSSNNVDITDGNVVNYELEPSTEKVLQKIADYMIVSKVYMSIISAMTSEHCTRMIAMDSASKNAKELTFKLTLEYNRTRQANITRDLIEIISGAESINKQD